MPCQHLLLLAANEFDFPPQLSENCNLQLGSVYITKERDGYIKQVKETEREKFTETTIIKKDNQAKPVHGKKNLGKKMYR